jgi:tetratricopeptide (TPR) repeat protein
MCPGLVLRPGIKSTPAAAELQAARIALGRQALAANPDNHKARSMLVNSLLQADRADLALDVFAADPGAIRSLDDLTALARAHCARRDFAAALHALEAARTCAGFGREQLLLRFEALIGHGDLAAAGVMLPEIQQLEPENAAALKLVVRDALRQGDPGRALDACDRILRIAPSHTSALHYRLVALALSQRHSEAVTAMGLDRFVTVRSLAVPGSWSDEREFHRQLAAEVHADASLRPDPRGLATSQGRQTQGRSQAEGPAMKALIACIGTAIEDYAAQLAYHDGAHPFIRFRPSRGSLLFWSVLYSGTGRQQPHFHPGGWLSGVYHASGCGAAADGGLVLGECVPLQRAGEAPPWGTRLLPSRAGQLVLFPSFVPHATTVPAAGIERVSVAFDVMACCE